MLEGGPGLQTPTKRRHHATSAALMTPRPHIGTPSARRRPAPLVAFFVDARLVNAGDAAARAAADRIAACVGAVLRFFQLHVDARVTWSAQVVDLGADKSAVRGPGRLAVQPVTAAATAGFAAQLRGASRETAAGPAARPELQRVVALLRRALSDCAWSATWNISEDTAVDFFSPAKPAAAGPRPVNVRNYCWLFAAFPADAAQLQRFVWGDAAASSGAAGDEEVRDALTEIQRELLGRGLPEEYIVQRRTAVSWVHVGAAPPLAAAAAAVDAALQLVGGRLVSLDEVERSLAFPGLFRALRQRVVNVGRLFRAVRAHDVDRVDAIAADAARERPSRPARSRGVLLEVPGCQPLGLFASAAGDGGFPVEGSSLAAEGTLLLDGVTRRLLEERGAALVLVGSDASASLRLASLLTSLAARRCALVVSLALERPLPTSRPSAVLDEDPFAADVLPMAKVPAIVVGHPVPGCALLAILDEKWRERCGAAKVPLPREAPQNARALPPAVLLDPSALYDPAVTRELPASMRAPPSGTSGAPALISGTSAGSSLTAPSLALYSPRRCGRGGIVGAATAAETSTAKSDGPEKLENPRETAGNDEDRLCELVLLRPCSLRHASATVIEPLAQTPEGAALVQTLVRTPDEIEARYASLDGNDLSSLANFSQKEQAVLERAIAGISLESAAEDALAQWCDEGRLWELQLALLAALHLTGANNLPGVGATTDALLDRLVIDCMTCELPVDYATAVMGAVPAPGAAEHEDDLGVAFVRVLQEVCPLAPAAQTLVQHWAQKVGLDDALAVLPSSPLKRAGRRRVQTFRPTSAASQRILAAAPAPPLTSRQRREKEREKRRAAARQRSQQLESFLAKRGIQCLTPAAPKPTNFSLPAPSRGKFLTQ